MHNVRLFIKEKICKMCLDIVFSFPQYYLLFYIIYIYYIQLIDLLIAYISQSNTKHEKQSKEYLIVNYFQHNKN